MGEKRSKPKCNFYMQVGIYLLYEKTRASSLGIVADDDWYICLLGDYQSGLVPPFCFSAAKSLFDAH
jgi:hypothetical protein